MNQDQRYDTAKRFNKEFPYLRLNQKKAEGLVEFVENNISLCLAIRDEQQKEARK